MGRGDVVRHRGQPARHPLRSRGPQVRADRPDARLVGRVSLLCRQGGADVRHAVRARAQHGRGRGDRLRRAHRHRAQDRPRAERRRLRRHQRRLDRQGRARQARGRDRRPGRGQRAARAQVPALRRGALGPHPAARRRGTPLPLWLRPRRRLDRRERPQAAGHSHPLRRRLHSSRAHGAVGGGHAGRGGLRQHAGLDDRGVALWLRGARAVVRARDQGPRRPRGRRPLLHGCRLVAPRRDARGVPGMRRHMLALLHDRRLRATLGAHRAAVPARHHRRDRARRRHPLRDRRRPRPLHRGVHGRPRRARRLSTNGQRAERSAVAMCRSAHATPSLRAGELHVHLTFLCSARTHAAPLA
mmetsp:Transcript_7724/g.12998  ORF Transcript_7724/g.12998 Transcript_7724/m.12998 type:complete len:357 (+) Transcript_7724:389-1459(+)